MSRASLAQTAGERSDIHGTVTTSADATALSNVSLTLIDDSDGADSSGAARRGKEIATVVSDADGVFRFASLRPGTYRLRAVLAGFEETTRGGLRVSGGEDLKVQLQIKLALSDRVEAVGRSEPVTATSSQTIEGAAIDIAPVKGDDFSALLPLLPGVVRGPDGRINLKGGRPTQTGLQLSNTYVSDPATGDAGFNLPVDAVESVSVLPNPYAAEYGRFSSGLAKIETRRGPDKWTATANNFIPAPCLKLCDGKNFGIRSFDPRLIVGGPIVRDRIFVSQSVQYHDHKDRVSSLASGDDTSFRSLDAFTRIDATLASHRLAGTFAAFPRDNHFVNLNTFTPQTATPNLQQRGYDAGLSHLIALSDTLVLESTVHAKQYDVTIAGQGNETNVIGPEGQSGNYFNSQTRHTHTSQWVESVRAVGHLAGEHLLKAGFDLLAVGVDGTSASHSVDVRREDGTLAQQITFGAPATQRASATDVGVFVQDAWRWNDRVLTELGARVDRDGLLGHTNVSPRIGVVFSVLPDAKGVVRGGIGRFYERTPLLVGTFDQMEERTVTLFGPDGAAPIATTRFVNQAGGLSTPSSRVWNVEYDHRINARTLLKVNHLERSGSGEFVVDPIASGGEGVLSLSSLGQSQYRETEVTLKYERDRGRQLTATYVRARSEADLNAFDVYFGNFRNPLIRPDQYSWTSVDVPNRLILLATTPVQAWTVAPLLEVRTGFPYSVVDGDQNFVGPRNESRFPVFWSLDLNIFRPVVIQHRHVRVGMKANHLLDNFAPRDVQANITSPAFGTYYNSIYRRIGLTVEIRP